jgi:hypothetical protein
MSWLSRPVSPPFPKLEALAEEPLLGHPFLELHPLRQPVIELWIIRVREVHPFGRDEAVERHPDAEEHLSHVQSPCLSARLRSALVAPPDDLLHW